MGRVEPVMALVCGWGGGRLSPIGLSPEPLASDVAPLTWFRLLNFSGTTGLQPRWIQGIGRGDGFGNQDMIELKI